MQQEPQELGQSYYKLSRSSLGKLPIVSEEEVNRQLTKAAVSILQTQLSSNRIVPKFVLEHIWGAAHDLIFTFRASFVYNGVMHSAVGSGKSKKEAKRAAARALLSEIPQGNKIIGDSIGWLQDMCRKSGWAAPTYKDETIQPQPQDELFTISCNILNLHEVGQGKSKKIAKRVAADKMWIRLQNTYIDDVNEDNTEMGQQEADH